MPLQNKPLVSVILPFRNTENFLEESIVSVLGQTYKEIELILVDNGSGDSSLRIASQHSKNDSRVNIFKSPKAGVAKAFNRGLKEVNGTFIARMDGDDIWEAQKLERQLEEFQNRPELDICFTSVKPLGKTPIGMLRYMAWQNQILSHEEIRKNQFIEFPVCNPTLLGKKEVFDRTYKEECYPEDYELFLFWMNRGKRITKITEKLHTWRDHDRRLTRSHSGYSKESFFNVKIHYLLEMIKSLNWNCENIAIWGAGKLSRKKIRTLSNFGLKPKVIFDFKMGQFMEIPILPYSEIDKKSHPHIISLVSNRNASYQIKKYLMARGFLEMQNFILAS